MIPDIIYVILYLLTEFLNYLLTYAIIFRAEITKEKIRWVLGIGLILVFHFYALYSGGAILSSNISVFTMLVVPVFLLKTKEKKWLILYPVVILGNSVIAVSCSFLLGIVRDIPEYMVTESKWMTLVCQSVPMSIMSVVYIYRKIRKYTAIQVRLGWQQYALFYIGVGCAFVLLGSLQTFTRGDMTARLINRYGFAVSISCIVFVFLCLWQGIIVYREIQYKEQNENYARYMKLQEEHFQELIWQDEKMRRFRHDMNAHMITLQSYCQTEHNEQLKEYVTSMINESAVYDVKKYTGNQGLDAIIRQLADETEKKEIELSIKGNVPEDVTVSVYDLCTIVSNLLKNAIEACEKITKVHNRKIIMEITSYNEFLYIRVMNTIEKDVEIRNNHLYTSKEDKKNHGLGSGNVERTAQKYEGNVTYLCENGWFIVEVSV